MHLLQRLRFCVFVAALVGEASVSIRLCDVHVLPRRVRCKRTAHCQVAGAEDGGCQKRAVRALRLRGGQETDQYAQSTSASIYRGSMPQDVSSEDEDTTLVHAMNTRSHQIQNPDATEIERLVKDTIYQAKIEEGLLPNPRYMNLSREEERQLELDELLWFAAEHGELNLAREALDAGANVSSRNRDFYNQTALHCAAQFNAGHPEMVELLVSRGADVNARNCHNNTALHEAAYWAYGSTVAKLLELGADPFVLNDLELTPLLNAEGNWAAIPRPTVALHNRDRNISLPLWEDETCGGWRHRLRTPEHRKEVVDMLKDAMGERAYGRGVDPYCGGIDFPDQWDEWNEKAEHYNPLSRPREFKTSVPPFRNPLETPLSVRPQWKPAKEMEATLDAEINQVWQRDKWAYYEQFPDESMSGEDKGEAEADKVEEEESVDSGKDEGQLIRPGFDAGGEGEGGQIAGFLEEDSMGGPELDDDGQDAEGAVTQKESD